VQKLREVLLGVAAAADEACELVGQLVDHQRLTDHLLQHLTHLQNNFVVVLLLLQSSLLPFARRLRFKLNVVY